MKSKILFSDEFEEDEEPQEEVAETEFCSSADSNSESERLLRVLDEIIAKKKKNNSEEES